MKGNIWGMALKYTALGLIIFLPFVFSYSTMDPVLVPRWQTATITLSALWVVLFLYIKSLKVSIEIAGNKLFWIGFLGFVLIGLSSIFYAVNQNEAIFSSLKWFSWFSFLVLFVQLFKNKVLTIELFLKTVLISSAIIAVIGVLQFLGGEFFLTKSIDAGVHGGLGNPNLLGSFLLIVLPISFYGFKLFKSRPLIVVLIILLLIAAFISKSRTVYIGAFAEIVLGVYFIRNQFPKYKKALLFVPAGFVVLSVVALLIFQSTDISNFLEFVSTKTLKTRITLASQSLEMIKDFPLFGVGSGNWKLYLAKYGLHHLPKAFQTGTSSYVRPHNDFVWVFAENGLLGGVFYLLFWVGGLLGILNFIKQNQDLGRILLITFLGFGLASLLDYPSERNMHMLFFMGLMAIPFSVKEDNSIKVSPLVIPIFLVGSLFSFHVANNRAEGEQLSAIVQNAYVKQDVRALNMAFKNFSIEYYDLDPTATPVYFFKGMVGAATQKAKQAIINFEKALEAHPWHLITLNNLGAMHKMQGNYKKALDSYEKATLVSNTYRRSELNRVEALILNKQLDKGMKAFLKLGLDNKDQTYKYLYQLLKENQISHVFEKYPELKNDKKYVESITTYWKYDKMFKTSIEQGVPLDIWILPFPPGEAPKVKTH